MILVTAALILGLGAQQAVEPERQSRAPQTDQTVPAARGTRLTVNNMAGEVNIRTWERDSLRVQATHSARTKVSIQTTPSGITLHASGSMGPAGAVDYTITAPAWMPIKVSGTYNFVSIEGAQSEVSADTVRGDIVVKGGTGFITAKSVEGEVILEGVRGKVTASSVNEGIRITASSGEISAETINGSIVMSRIDSKSVSASTVNGDITYDGSAVDGGRYSFTTHNGDITMAIPESSNATFSIRTYNGDFKPSLPVTGVGEARRGKRLTYVLGTGSAEVELESFGGTIRLRRPGIPTAKEKK